MNWIAKRMTVVSQAPDTFHGVRGHLQHLAIANAGLTLLPSFQLPRFVQNAYDKDYDRFSVCQSIGSLHYKESPGLRVQPFNVSCFQPQDSERVCEPADFRPPGDALQPLRRPGTRPQSQRVARWEILPWTQCSIGKGVQGY